MSRTSSLAVQGVLNNDYDGTTDLTPYIDSASVIVDRVATCATRKGMSLTTPELEITERWLAAHFYAQSDKPFASKSTSGASASFNGQTAMGLDSTLYGQTAMRIDYSGCLVTIDKKQRARMVWLGKTEPEQLDYTQRN